MKEQKGKEMVKKDVRNLCNYHKREERIRFTQSSVCIFVTDIGRKMNSSTAEEFLAPQKADPYYR